MDTKIILTIVFSSIISFSLGLLFAIKLLKKKINQFEQKISDLKKLIDLYERTFN